MLPAVAAEVEDAPDPVDQRRDAREPDFGIPVSFGDVVDRVLHDQRRVVRVERVDVVQVAIAQNGGQIHSAPEVPGQLARGTPLSDPHIR